MGPWQPIKEARRDGTHYWLYEKRPNGVAGEGMWSPVKECWVLIKYGGEDSDYSDTDPTHFIELPELP